jgi:hemin uptake protein HemP
MMAAPVETDAAKAVMAHPVMNGPAIPCHDAAVLTGPGRQALIVLGDQTYKLRITRAGKLILTK